MNDSTTEAERPRTSLPLLTTSAARLYRACPRAYRYQYEDGYRTARASDALRFGTLMHAALEAWWLAPRAAPEHEWLADALAVIDAPRDRPTEDGEDFERAKARALMLGYHARWASAPLTAVAVELQYEIELLNPATGAASRTWLLGGKMDGIVKDAERQVLRVIEHKTTSEDIGIGSDYWTRLTLDPQVSNYIDAARSRGYDVVDCLYDVIRKPSLQPYKATPIEARKYTKPTKADPEPRLYANQREHDETPEEYFERLCEAIAADPDRYYQRGTIVRLEQDQLEASYDRWQIGRQIRESQKANAWPRNPDACKRYGRTCEFMPVCIGVASLDDPTLYRRSETPHEELTTTAMELQL